MQLYKHEQKHSYADSSPGEHTCWAWSWPLFLIIIYYNVLEVFSQV